MKKLLIIFFTLTSIFCKAQDFHLSLYDAAPLFLNPAMTGLVEGKIRAHAQYRTQWNAIAYKPFTTALASFDMPKGKWGFGGQISNMRAGLGNYNVLSALASVGYAVPLDKNKYHNLSFGIQAGFTQKQVEYQLLTYDNQWSTLDGGSFDKGLPSGENFNGQTFFQETVNFGALYYYSKQQARFNPFVGFSAFNLTRPKESFTGGPNRLPIRNYANAGVRVNISELLYVIPKILIYNQDNIIQQTYGVDIGYYFKGEKFFAIAGIMLRPNDATVPNIGFRKDNFIIRMAYDINQSGLKTVSKTRGAFEISLTYLGRKAKVQSVKNCPRL
ncbi:MAG: PorP/SprF family type IX secretion system membrane protein [Bacteroidetes bacterium]|nr:PorP/SprF family type IX secretion system membrane protein [Bacteroidota bacterium]